MVLLLKRRYVEVGTKFPCGLRTTINESITCHSKGADALAAATEGS